jgi:hypothetical protein
MTVTLKGAPTGWEVLAMPHAVCLIVPESPQLSKASPANHNLNEKQWRPGRAA